MGLAVLLEPVALDEALLAHAALVGSLSAVRTLVNDERVAVRKAPATSLAHERFIS